MEFLAYTLIVALIVQGLWAWRWRSRAHELAFRVLACLDEPHRELRDGHHFDNTEALAGALASTLGGDPSVFDDLLRERFFHEDDPENNDEDWHDDIRWEPTTPPKKPEGPYTNILSDGLERSMDAE